MFGSFVPAVCQSIAGIDGHAKLLQQRLTKFGLGIGGLKDADKTRGVLSHPAQPPLLDIGIPKANKS